MIIIITPAPLPDTCTITIFIINCTEIHYNFSQHKYPQLAVAELIIVLIWSIISWCLSDVWSKYVIKGKIT
jgi:hypothetical protein